MDEDQLWLEKRRLRRQISRFLKRSSRWSERLINAFQSRGWEAFLFGGVPRGVHRSEAYNPRDLDIVFADKDFFAFASLFSEYITRQTRFGGIHLVWAEIEIDAWPLSATWAFREKLTEEPSFSNLVKTTFFTADALAVEVSVKKGSERRIYEHGFFQAWHDRILEINLEANLFPELCVVRGLRLADTYNFGFSPQFVWFILRLLRQSRVVSFEAIQTSHYGEVIYSDHFIYSLANKMEQHLDQSPLLPFSPFVLGLDDSTRRLKRTNKRAFFYPF